MSQSSETNLDFKSNDTAEKLAKVLEDIVKNIALFVRLARGRAVP